MDEAAADSPFEVSRFEASFYEENPSHCAEYDVRVSPRYFTVPIQTQYQMSVFVDKGANFPLNCPFCGDIAVEMR